MFMVSLQHITIYLLSFEYQLSARPHQNLEISIIQHLLAKTGENIE
jgi:hypothetical protein